MQKFTPSWRGRPWEDGFAALHAYLAPRAGVDDELLALAHACRPAMLSYPIDPAIPAEPGTPGTLHVTIEMIADVPACDISVRERDVLIDALRKELADVAPFVAELGPPLAGRAGAVLDVWPDGQVLALQERVRAAIRATRGEAALVHSGGRPHCSLGYSNPRELHQTGANALVGRSQADALTLRGAYSLAV
ncbi:2'-5' RNA ligase family protein [Streptomyces sp. NPDC050085]|uniref:2'-5' RNA ligase family protein n=1 Tax=Streptomyces sp. NPDC050085 TaxID=3365600 RepID=UPI00378D77A5